MPSFLEAYIVTFLIAFLIGSIPFGLIISKLFFKTDIRAHGSGNIGTTNAIRTMGKRGGAIVFILDFAKGVLSGFVGLWVGQFFANMQGHTVLAEGMFSLLKPLEFAPLGDAGIFPVFFVEVLLALSLCGCVLGHIFSPWLKFKGGKGIAVAIGCVFVVFGVPAACLELAIFIVLVLVTRYVSIGSIAAALACPFFALYLYLGNPTAVFFCVVTGGMIVWAHRENIKRLLQKTENRIGQKKEKA